MDIASLSAKTLSPWKKLVVIALSGGVGFALTTAVIVGCVVWHKSRPSPWNTKVVIAIKPPGFSVSDDNKSIELAYTLENTGGHDFHLDSASPIKVFARIKDGTLIGPFGDKTVLSIHFPVFIPARQKTAVLVSMPVSEIPTRTVGERDTEYHERIRKLLEQRNSSLSCFVVFDSINRYEVDLPKWRSEPAKEQAR